MGPLPTAGQWVQLKVPASQVGLEGSTLNGMAFTLYGGRSTWDAAGRLSQTGTTTTSTAAPVTLSLNGGKPILTWASSSGHTYRVQYKNALSDSSWTTAA